MSMYVYSRLEPGQIHVFQLAPREHDAPLVAETQHIPLDSDMKHVVNHTKPIYYIQQTDSRDRIPSCSTSETAL